MVRSIIFACGGTGGHIYPALAMAKLFSEKGFSCHFVGTKGRMEAELIPKNHYSISFIWISGFVRSLTLRNLLFPLKVLVSLVQSFFLLSRLKPALVIGTGGYVSGPVLYVASKLNIPTLIQEQNSYPGITTRLLEKYVDEVHIAYEQTQNFLKKKNVYLSGNPIRCLSGDKNKRESLKQLGLGESFTICVLGGSLGARSINEVIATIYQETPIFNNINLIWQTGITTYRKYRNIALSHGILKAYFDDMGLVYSASDLIICRAGAVSLSEIAFYGKPAILIPYPFATGNHQYHNARAFLDGGAAILLEDDKFLFETLKKTLKKICSGKIALQKMSKNMKNLAKPKAAETIVSRGIFLINEQRAKKSGDNQLTKLDISNNRPLFPLNCDNNNLVSLDVSNKKAFKELYFS